MNIDIPHYIKLVLREDREVYLPGLGLISLIQTPAYFSENKSILNPPQLSLVFHSTDTGSNKLSQYIQDDIESVDCQVVDEAIKEYSSGLSKGILEDDQATIEGLGILKRDEDKVHLIQTNDKITSEYEGLNPLSLSPISRMLEPSAITYAVGTETLEDKEEKVYSPWWLPILAGLLLALIWVFLTRGCNSNDVPTLGMLNEDLIEEMEGGDFKVQPDTLLEQQYNEVDKLLNDENSSEVLVGDTNSSPDFKVKPDVEGENGGGTEADYSKYKDIIPSSGECIIIVGSFKRASNVTKMVSELERKDYRAVTKDYGDFTRVGFKFDCTNVDLEDYLTQIRKSIHKKAWYLEPEYYVEYK